MGKRKKKDFRIRDEPEGRTAYRFGGKQESSREREGRRQLNSTAPQNRKRIGGFSPSHRILRTRNGFKGAKQTTNCEKTPSKGTLKTQVRGGAQNSRRFVHGYSKSKGARGGYAVPETEVPLEGKKSLGVLETGMRKKPNPTITMRCSGLGATCKVETESRLKEMKK